MSVLQKERVDSQVYFSVVKMKSKLDSFSVNMQLFESEKANTIKPIQNGLNSQ